MKAQGSGMSKLFLTACVFHCLTLVVEKSQSKHAICSIRNHSNIPNIVDSSCLQWEFVETPNNYLYIVKKNSWVS